MKFALCTALLTLFGTTAMPQTDAPPEVTIQNGTLTAKLYLPDAGRGFYRGTRFDWSGVIHSLRLGQHDYYGPWFTKTDPSIHDFEYRGSDIVAGPCSATTGPVNEFAEVGYDEAAAAGTFIKIGIGALRKPDSQPYDNYRLYEIADAGVWKVDSKADSVTFTQTLSGTASPYAYVYRKTVELAHGEPRMFLRHSLKNTGKRAIRTNVYNHNFFVLDGKPPSPGVSITVPFDIKSAKPPQPDLAVIKGNQILYRKQLNGHDTATTEIGGHGAEVGNNRFRIENTTAGAGMSAMTDRPLLKESLWSIRSVIAVEPFITISVEPGAEFTWTTQYDYYTLPHK